MNCLEACTKKEELEEKIDSINLAISILASANSDNMIEHNKVRFAARILQDNLNELSSNLDHLTACMENTTLDYSIHVTENITG